LRNARAAPARGQHPAAEPRVDPPRQAGRLPARRFLPALSQSARAVARPRALGDHGGGLSAVKSNKPTLRLKRGHDTARTHPWIFKGDVADASDVEPGSAVAIVDAAGRFVGRGFYNPKPALCCRILTWTDEPIDAAFFHRRLDAAVGLRGRCHAPGPPALCRLVWSEADGLPGLVVDRYGPVLVTQCLTLGMARARPLVTAGLGRLFPDAPVFDMDDPHSAQLEGFSAALGWTSGSGPRTV